MKATYPSILPLLAVLDEAGALARTMQSHVSLSVKPDGTVVTEADLSCHTMLSKALRQMTPDIPVLSEEQPLEQNRAILAEASCFWAVDPIDVTANYAAGGDAYSINVALVEEGTPVLGALYFPGMDELYYTGDDGRAYKRQGREVARTIHVAPLQQDGQQVAAVRPNGSPAHVPVSQGALRVIFSRGQRRACLVATGEATFCSERAGFRIWDSAATYAIIHAAGGAIEQQGGAPLRYNSTLELPAYMVAHPELLRHLRAIPLQGADSPSTEDEKRKKA